jgi:hypothetical protein
MSIKMSMMGVIALMRLVNDIVSFEIASTGEAIFVRLSGDPHGDYLREPALEKRIAERRKVKLPVDKEEAALELLRGTLK